MQGQYSFPTAITFGPDVHTQLGDHLSSQGLKRPLIVTDRALAKLPPVQQIQKAMRDQRPTVYSEIWGNPVGSQVLGGVQAYQENKCDCIVAIGGGASMDVAKVIGLMATHPGELFEYDAMDLKRPIDQPLPHLVALPTTAGTGSEVGRAAVVSDDKTHRKVIFFHRRLLPKQVFADPHLTLQLPASVTAATGLDALTHLIEAYIARGFHPICDGIALEGIRLVKSSLADCVEFARKKDSGSPEHVKARSEMLIAALMGAVAFQKGLGMTHSCCNALTTFYPDLHHGLGNGILLPYTMEFNREAVPERFDRMAIAAGLRNGGEFIQWVRDLNQAVGIPSSLSGQGVTTERMDGLVEQSMGDLCTPENPRDLKPDDFRQLFTQAIAK